MTFRVRIGRIAQQDIDRFAVYAAEYSENWASDQFARLERIFSELSETPLRRSFFALTGAPYRASLFQIGRRTRYWIIYLVDEEARCVDVLRFWNASRDPETFDPTGRADF